MPVVSDFILISDEFQSSPAPIYVVIEGDMVSEEGRQASGRCSGCSSDERVTVVVSDLWSTLDASRGSNPSSSALMLSVDDGEEGPGRALVTG